jgi:hypothetical protein
MQPAGRIKRETEPGPRLEDGQGDGGKKTPAASVIGADAPVIDACASVIAPDGAVICAKGAGDGQEEENKKGFPNNL